MRDMYSQLPTALLYYLIRVLLSSGLQSICKGCGLQILRFIMLSDIGRRSGSPSGSGSFVVAGIGE
ncbi:unnamed protein product [Prunus brigantina]